MDINTNTNAIKAGKWKFIIFSVIGFFLFLVPIPYKDSFTIPVGIVIDFVKSIIHDYTLLPLVLLITINAIATVVTKIFKPAFIMKNNWLKNSFDASMLYVVSRVIGMIIALMFYFKVGPEFVISDTVFVK